MRKQSMKIIFILFVLSAIGYFYPCFCMAAPEAPEFGMASFYSYECADQPMANGESFDPEKRTAASWFYDLGTVLLVKSLDTGLMTEVVVTDRGPNKRLVKKGRIIDLSKRAFEDICALQKGLTNVTITIVAKKE